MNRRLLGGLLRWGGFLTVIAGVALRRYAEGGAGAAGQILTWVGLAMVVLSAILRMFPVSS